MNVTHVAGQIMADTVGGTLERFDIFANIKPMRIPGQHLLRNQMVALGMMYTKSLTVYNLDIIYLVLSVITTTQSFNTNL